jgi:hypothetical protein
MAVPVTRFDITGYLSCRPTSHGGGYSDTLTPGKGGGLQWVASLTSHRLSPSPICRGPGSTATGMRHRGPGNGPRLDNARPVTSFRGRGEAER